jgi:hypothetical protein
MQLWGASATSCGISLLQDSSLPLPTTESQTPMISVGALPSFYLDVN